MSGWKGLQKGWIWGQTYPCQDKQLQRAAGQKKGHCCSKWFSHIGLIEAAYPSIHNKNQWLSYEERKGTSYVTQKDCRTDIIKTTGWYSIGETEIWDEHRAESSHSPSYICLSFALPLSARCRCFLTLSLSLCSSCVSFQGGRELQVWMRAVSMSSLSQLLLLSFLWKPAWWRFGSVEFVLLF